MSRARLPVVLALALLLLLSPGCVTVMAAADDVSDQDRFPRAFGGLRGHAELMHLLKEDYVALCFLTFPDLPMSLALDLALLPITGPAALVRHLCRRTPASPPPPPRPAAPPARPAPIAPPRPAPRWDPAAAARARARAELTPTLDEALARAEVLAPADRARREALARERGSILRSEDDFLWLPEWPAPDDPVYARHLAGFSSMAGPGPGVSLVFMAHVAERTQAPAAALEACEQLLDRDPGDGVAWTIRGWAHLAIGELDRAEADLLLGAAQVTSGINAGWAIAGLGRVHEARGDLEGALRRYVVALGCLPAVPPGAQACDAAGELRARIERLRARR